MCVSSHLPPESVEGGEGLAGVCLVLYDPQHVPHLGLRLRHSRHRVCGGGVRRRGRSGSEVGLGRREGRKEGGRDVHVHVFK